MDIELDNGKLTNLEEKIIITIFSIVIILGIFGNLLVIWTVLFNKNMRTSNNVIIINLAISDLILCFFSIPFNAYKTLRHTWKFSDFLCRLTPFFQASNVFVSSMSITAIALDRYIHIVCAVRLRQSSAKSSQIRIYVSMLICGLIWMFAFALSSPLFYYNTITHESFSLFPNENEQNLETLPMNNEFILNYSNKTASILSQQMTTHSSVLNEENNDNYVLNVNHCVENWHNHTTRMIYSYSSLLIQYILPILIVGIAYGRIWWKLKNHRRRLRKHDFTLNDPETKQELKSNTFNMNDVNTQASMNIKIKRSSLNNDCNKRRRKMNILLMSISIIFAVSWLPLNIFNVLSDLKLSIIRANHTYFLINAICILVGMSSAVSNPCLYGVFNENFRREYSRLFKKLFTRFFFGKTRGLGDATTFNRTIRNSIKSNDKCNNNKSAEQNKLIANNSNSNVNNQNNNNNTKDEINYNPSNNNLKEKSLNEMQ